MFVGDSAEFVRNAADLARGEVSVHVESAEVRLQSRVLPYALCGYAHSAVLGFECYGDEVEPVPVALERFVREYGVDRGLRVRVEPFLLVFRIPFGNYGYVYAVFGASALQKVSVSGCGGGEAVDKYIVRVYPVPQRRADLAVGVEQPYVQRCRTLRHGNEQHVFEGLSGRGRLQGGLPFLEQGGEAGYVYRLSVRLVGQFYLAVASEGQRVEIVAASGPSRERIQFVHIYRLRVAAAGEYAVYAQRAVAEVRLETVLPGAAYCLSWARRTRGCGVGCRDTGREA